MSLRVVFLALAMEEGGGRPVLPGCVPMSRREGELVAEILPAGEFPNGVFKPQDNKKYTVFFYHSLPLQASPVWLLCYHCQQEWLARDGL